MNTRLWLAIISALCLSCACAAPPAAPTALPAPLALPTRPPAATQVLPIPALAPLPSRGDGQFPPAEIPACKGALALERLPLRFSWEMANVAYENVYKSAPLENWTYYRCAESPAAVLAFYRNVLTRPNWEEHTSDQRAEGTLVIFDNAPVTVSPSFRWVYLWFVPDPSDGQGTYLVAAWWNGPHTC